MFRHLFCNSVEVNLVIGLTEQPMPTKFFHARTLRDVGNQLLKIANAVRIALHESVNELCCGGFFFFLLVLNVLRIVSSGRKFLDDTVAIRSCCFLEEGEWSMPVGSFSTPSRVPMYFTRFPALDAFLMYRLVKIIFAILAFLIPIGFFKGDNAIAIAHVVYAFFMQALHGFL